MRVGDALRERRGLGRRARLHHTHDLEVEAVRDLLPYERGVIGHVRPTARLGVLAVEIGGGQHLEARPQGILVGEVHVDLGHIDLARAAHGAVHHAIELGGVEHAEAVKRVVGNLAAGREHEHAFIGLARPTTGHHVVLLVEQLGIVNHLVEGGGARHHRARHGGRARPAGHSRGQGVGRDLDRIGTLVRAVHERRDAVIVLDGGHLSFELIGVLIEEGLEARHVVRLHAGEHVGEHGEHGNLITRLGLGVIVRGGSRVVTGRALPRRAGGIFARRSARVARHHAREVVALAGNGERIARQRVLLDFGDIAVHTVGERQDRRDADDADRTREGRHDGAALLGHQVVEGERQRREQAHGRALLGVSGRLAARPFRQSLGKLLLAHRTRVVHDTTVLDAHDARGVVFSELRIVRNHNHEPLARDLGKQVHDLDARLSVEGTRGFVGQHDLRVVHQRAGNRDALHLTARELGRLLVDMAAQTHALERCRRPARALGRRDARQGESKLDVGEHRLVRDEVITLEDEAHAVVTIGVPLGVTVVTRGDAVDHDVTGVGVVKSAQDVQKGGLA